MEFLASADVDRVYPFEGDTDHWIEVKKELTAGEERQITGAAVRRVSRSASDDAAGDGRVAFDLDYGQASFMKVAVYLHDWNFTGKDGKQIDIATSGKKFDALKALKPSVFKAVEAAIDAHVRGRGDEKKASSGASTSTG